MWKKSYSFQQSPHINVFKKIRSSLPKSREVWSNLIGWWLLGVCVDFGFWTIISGAHDLMALHDQHHNITARSKYRECNMFSEGYILIFSDLPTLIATIVMPFLPFWVHIRVVTLVIFSVSSCITIGINANWGLTISGVALGSVFSGIGLSTFLQYMNAFKNSPIFSSESIIFAWSSGIGASGFFASLYYALATENGISIQTVVFSMLLIPALMAYAFWFLLSNPNKSKEELPEFNTEVKVEPEIVNELTFIQKFHVFYKVVLKYSAPLTLTFFSQYVINQGVIELIYFDESVISLKSRVRWLAFDYLFSNMIFKSSGHWIKTDRLWFLTFLQVFNIILVVTDAIFGWMGRGALAFGIIILIVFWEGAISGIMYVNTFRRINKERTEIDRAFSLSITALGEPLGIIAAAIADMIIHKAICNIPTK